MIFRFHPDRPVLESLGPGRRVTDERAASRARAPIAVRIDADRGDIGWRHDRMCPRAVRDPRRVGGRVEQRRDEEEGLNTEVTRGHMRFLSPLIALLTVGRHRGMCPGPGSVSMSEAALTVP